MTPRSKSRTAAGKMASSLCTLQNRPSAPVANHTEGPASLLHSSDYVPDRSDA